tara:strand:- start:172 stop:315 length:144 start_codon:yes stop_codon:yes gene_type:complete
MKSNYNIVGRAGLYYVQDLRRYFKKSNQEGVIRRRRNGRVKRVKGVE